MQIADKLKDLSPTSSNWGGMIRVHPDLLEYEQWKNVISKRTEISKKKNMNFNFILLIRDDTDASTNLQIILKKNE